jgi:hypothetical protein
MSSKIKIPKLKHLQIKKRKTLFYCKIMGIGYSIQKLCPKQAFPRK